MKWKQNFKLKAHLLRMKNRYFWIAILSLNLFAYLNCSQPYDINETAYTGPLSLSAVPVSLAQSTAYTNKPAIPLAFSFVNNPKDMYLTLVPGCGSGGDWIPYTSKATLPWPNPDGQATAYAKFRNFHLVETPCYDVSVTIDTTPPSILLSSQPGTLTNSHTATFSMTVTDSLSGLDYIECSLDGAKYLNCPETAVFNGLADGNHSMSVRAYDKAGNVSNVLTSSWVIDTRAPGLSVTAYPPPITNQTNAHFEFAATDSTGGSGVSKYACQLGTAVEYSCQSPVNLSGLPDGNLSFSISVIDQAGNRATQKINWIVDTTPPTVVISTSPNAWTYSKNLQYMFTFDDTATGSGLDHYMCTFEKLPSSGTAVPVKCPSGVIYTNLVDGTYSFTVVAYDRAGNASQPVQKTVTIDTVLPTITLNSGSLPKPYAQGTYPSFSFQANDNNGIHHISCQLNAQAPQDCSSGFMNYSQLADGAYTFKAVAYDGAGNSATASYSWIIDTTPPTVKLVNPPAKGSTSLTFTFVFSGTDTGSGIDHYEYSIDYQPNISCPSTVCYITVTAAPSHSYNVFSVDRAGNRSTHVLGTW